MPSDEYMHPCSINKDLTLSPKPQQKGDDGLTHPNWRASSTFGVAVVTATRVAAVTERRAEKRLNILGSRVSCF